MFELYMDYYGNNSWLINGEYLEYTFFLFDRFSELMFWYCSFFGFFVIRSDSF